MPANEVDALIKEFELGDKAKDFIKGDLGQHILQNALAEIEHWRDRLEEVDPEDSATIRKAQLQIKARRLTINWITEAIQRGENAGANLEVLDSPDN